MFYFLVCKCFCFPSWYYYVLRPPFLILLANQKQRPGSQPLNCVVGPGGAPAKDIFQSEIGAKMSFYHNSYGELSSNPHLDVIET